MTTIGIVLFPQLTQLDLTGPLRSVLPDAGYHVRPDDAQGGLADDIRKRLGLIRSGRFLVRSLTWDDVDEFARNQDLPGVSLFIDLNVAASRMRTLLNKIQSPLSEKFLVLVRVWDSDPLSGST